MFCNKKTNEVKYTETLVKLELKWQVLQKLNICKRGLVRWYLHTAENGTWQDKTATDRKS